MNSNNTGKNWYDDDSKFDWQQHEQRQYNRFVSKARMLGLFIMIITAIGTLVLIYKSWIALLNYFLNE